MQEVGIFKLRTIALNQGSCARMSCSSAICAASSAPCAHRISSLKFPSKASGCSWQLGESTDIHGPPLRSHKVAQVEMRRSAHDWATINFVRRYILKPLWPRCELGPPLRLYIRLCLAEGDYPLPRYICTTCQPLLIGLLQKPTRKGNAPLYAAEPEQSPARPCSCSLAG
jgi:hypothetical protein